MRAGRGCGLTKAVLSVSACARRISRSRREYDGSAAGGLWLKLPEPPRPVERTTCAGAARATGARSRPRGQGKSWTSPLDATGVEWMLPAPPRPEDCCALSRR
jgi:hypothetical protein